MKGFTLAIAAAVLQFGGIVIGAPPGILEERGAVMLTAPAASLDYTSIPAVNARSILQERDVCDRTVIGTREATYDFNGLGQYCGLYSCPLFKRLPLSNPRGGGYLWREGTTEPMFFPHVDKWEGINCTAFAGEPLGNACFKDGEQHSTAIYSPGVSPYDPTRMPTIGSVEFGNEYLYFDLISFYIFPLLDEPDAKAHVYIRSIPLDKENPGTLSDYVVSNNKLHQISGGKGYFGLSALQIWVKKEGGGDKLYPFVLDNIRVVEQERSPRLPECRRPPPEAVKGPCTPTPVTVTSFTANFDEFPLQTALPKDYMSVDWSTSQYQVLNRSSNGNNVPSDMRIRPGAVIPPSAKNFLYVPDGNMVFSASTYEKRFGVKEMAILCSFPKWSEYDYELTNGKPCRVTFIGRRDPYDGSGLPTIVRGGVQFPNPNNDTSDRPFQKIKLDTLTSQAGGFSRLVSLQVLFEIGDKFHQARAAVDDIVFERELGEGKNCRAPGAITLDFDDLKAGGLSVPSVYKGFKFEDRAWSVTDRANYKPGTPGYIAAVSAPNAVQRMQGTSNRPINNYFSSFVNGGNEFLFDLESLTITADVDPTNTKQVQDLVITLSVMDACGFQNNESPKNVNQYSTQIVPGKLQIEFSQPLLRISYLAITLSYRGGSLYKGFPNFWIDEINYRKYAGATPGCASCGYRGLDLCEFPPLTR